MTDFILQETFPEYGPKRLEWGPGPWENEADRYHWIDKETDLDCLIVRNSLGNLCGYVGVPPEHPLHAIGYSSCPIGCGEDWCRHSPQAVIDVHGGLTYSAFCDKGDAICHVPLNGRAENVFWFGFDCAHSGDLTPSVCRFQGALSQVEQYRNVKFVRTQCEKLAQQLKAYTNDQD